MCIYFYVCVAVRSTEYIKHLDSSCSDRSIAEGMTSKLFDIDKL